MARIVFYPPPDGVVVSGVAWGISSDGGGGLILLLVPPSRFSSRSICSVPAVRSIFIVSVCGRAAMCAVFVSSFYCVVRWRRGVSFPSFRLVPLLVVSSGGASRLYSLRFASRLVLLINSFGVSLSRLVRRFVRSSRSGGLCFFCLALRSSVSCLARFIVFRLVYRLVCSSRQAVRVLSFRLGGL